MAADLLLQMRQRHTHVYASTEPPVAVLQRTAYQSEHASAEFASRSGMDPKLASELERKLASMRATVAKPPTVIERATPTLCQSARSGTDRALASELERTLALMRATIAEPPPVVERAIPTLCHTSRSGTETGLASELERKLASMRAVSARSVANSANREREKLVSSGCAPDASELESSGANSEREKLVTRKCSEVNLARTAIVDDSSTASVQIRSHRVEQRNAVRQSSPKAAACAPVEGLLASARSAAEAAENSWKAGPLDDLDFATDAANLVQELNLEFKDVEGPEFTVDVGFWHSLWPLMPPPQFGSGPLCLYFGLLWKSPAGGSLTTSKTPRHLQAAELFPTPFVWNQQAGEPFSTAQGAVVNLSQSLHAWFDASLEPWRVEQSSRRGTPAAWIVCTDGEGFALYEASMSYFLNGCQNRFGSASGGCNNHDPLDTVLVADRAISSATAPSFEIFRIFARTGNGTTMGCNAVLFDVCSVTNV